MFHTVHADAIGSVSLHPFKPIVLTAVGSRKLTTTALDSGDERSDEGNNHSSDTSGDEDEDSTSDSESNEEEQSESGGMEENEGAVGPGQTSGEGVPTNGDPGETSVFTPLGASQVDDLADEMQSNCLEMLYFGSDEL